MPLGKISTQEAQKLTKQYLATERRIKDRLALAISRGNDTTYLNATLRAVEKEIKQLNLIYKGFAQLNLNDIIDQQAKSVDSQVFSFDKKFNIDSSFGQVNREAMNVVAQNTYSSLNSVTLAMGRQTKGFLRQIGLKAASGIIDGSTTWQQAARGLKKDLEKADFFFVKYKMKDDTFRKVPAAVYSKMVARTTAAEAFRISTHERIKSWGYDLVDVVGRSSWPESPCIPFQGKTLSITGKTEGYTSLEAARAAGFFHPNCIHTTVFSDKNVELVPDTAKKPVEKVTNIATKQKTKSKATSKPVSELKPRKAKTIAEALANTEKLADKVELKNIKNVDGLNQFNDTLTDLYKKYPISVNKISKGVSENKLFKIGTITQRAETMKKRIVFMNATSSEININPEFINNVNKYFENSVTNYKKSVLLETETLKFQKELTIKQYADKLEHPNVKKYIKNIDKQLKNNIKDMKFSRGNVLYKDREIEACTAHEYGHTLSMRLINSKGKFFNHDKYMAVLNAYKKADDTGDIFNVSKYATTNLDEFFAECFTIHHLGIEKLPDYINNMISEVIKP